MRDLYDGKTAAERVAGRRQRLVDAGLVLFGENGYAGTSIRAVLRQSGLQERYFSESFADLDELLAAVHEQLSDEEIARCREAIEATGGGSDGQRALIETLTRSLQSDGPRARILLRESLLGGPACKRVRKQSLLQWARMVADLLPKGPQADSRRRLLLGLSVVAAGDELVRGWLDGDKRFTRKQVIDVIMVVFDSIAGTLGAT